MKKLKSLLLISLAVCILVGCQTTKTNTEYILPTLDAFEPPRVPNDLIEEPQTDADLLHNSIQLEFLLYEWQDYADSLKEYLEAVREQLQ